LHDQLGQLLTVLRLRLDHLKQETDRGKMRDTMDEIIESAQHLEAEIDFLTWELRPPMLDDLGLQITLENYVREWSEHNRIPVAFHPQRLQNRRLTGPLEINLYRIVQEALNNVAKHSQAANVEILLEPRDNNIVLIIEDDGRGFTEPHPAGRELGLAGLRERAMLMNGTAEIEGIEGKGTTIFVRVPAQWANDENADA
jgi:signal transduction histidine kinase